MQNSIKFKFVFIFQCRISLNKRRVFRNLEARDYYILLDLDNEISKEINKIYFFNLMDIKGVFQN